MTVPAQCPTSSTPTSMNCAGRRAPEPLCRTVAGVVSEFQRIGCTPQSNAVLYVLLELRHKRPNLQHTPDGLTSGPGPVGAMAPAHQGSGGAAEEQPRRRHLFYHLPRDAVTVPRIFLQQEWMRCSVSKKYHSCLVIRAREATLVVRLFGVGPRRRMAPRCILIVGSGAREHAIGAAPRYATQ